MIAVICVRKFSEGMYKGNTYMYCNETERLDVDFNVMDTDHNDVRRFKRNLFI